MLSNASSINHPEAWRILCLLNFLTNIKSLNNEKFKFIAQVL
jgi:hypothetical protein